MGGKFSRALIRPFKNYNVEDRAQRVLDRSQHVPRPAPRYPSEAAIARSQQQQQQQPSNNAGGAATSGAGGNSAFVVEEKSAASGAATSAGDLHAKQHGLNERLKGLYVQTVSEPRPVDNSSTVGASRSTSGSKKLPENRHKIPDTEYGYVESSVAPSRGRVTLKQALELISNHYMDKKQFDAATLAKQYSLEARQTQQLLRYFQSYHLAMPSKSDVRQEAAPSTSALTSGQTPQLSPSKQSRTNT